MILPALCMLFRKHESNDTASKKRKTSLGRKKKYEFVRRQAKRHNQREILRISVQGSAVFPLDTASDRTAGYYLAMYKSSSRDYLEIPHLLSAKIQPAKCRIDTFYGRRRSRVKRLRKFFSRHAHIACIIHMFFLSTFSVRPRLLLQPQCCEVK